MQKYLGDLNANTQLTVQQRSEAATAALAAVNNASAQQIAHIQGNTALSVAQQQTQSAQAIAALDNANKVAVQQLQNAGSLANIQTNGAINMQIQNITNANKTLLQTSQGAATLYNQALANLSNIITNPNLSHDQQAAALNDGVAQLNAGLQSIEQIATNVNANSLLQFS
jgi:hypothetical protein